MFQWRILQFLHPQLRDHLFFQLNVLFQLLVDVILAVTRFAPLLCRRPLFLSLALAPPRTRLSLISRHLDQRPQLEINTPFSTERLSKESDDLEYTPVNRVPQGSDPSEEKLKMPNQAEHPALLIPGPIEFDDEVLQSMGHFRFVYPCTAFLRPD